MNYDKFLNNIQDISTSDISLKKALAETRKFNPAVGKVLAKHIYTDTLCPWVGNRFAYNDFLSRHKHHGIHVSVDLNSFSNINNTQGHLAGDEAIKKFFKISSEISRGLKGKNFRVGGDENRLFFDSPKAAETFASMLKERLSTEKIGDHILSASVGIGYTPEEAELALKQAKEELGPMFEGERIKRHAVGQEPTSIVSNLSKTPPNHWKAPAQSPKEEAGLLKLRNPLK